MKLLVVACVKESREEVAKIFKQANINVFSAADITGFKDHHKSNILKDWFASGAETFDSLLLFSFTEAENASLGMELIKRYNIEFPSAFPLRSFIIPVEEAVF
jgi:hypothetical protein